MLKVDKLSNETVILQSPGIIASDMNGETVMMSIENGKYYNLGTIGGDIWRSIESPTSIKQLISILTNEFDVEANRCEKEVIPFLEMLLKEKLITIETSQM